MASTNTWLSLSALLQARKRRPFEAQDIQGRRTPQFAAVRLVAYSRSLPDQIRS
jgi:hypothetical protein